MRMDGYRRAGEEPGAAWRTWNLPPRCTVGLCMTFMLLAFCIGCSGDASDRGWDIGEQDSSDAGETGCEPAEPPECGGGHLSEVTTDAGCTIERCYCSDRELYHEPSGECVLAIGPRPHGRPCNQDADCQSDYCDKRYVGSEECGVCLETCERGDPETACSESTDCIVPGDFAGYCMPACNCDGETPCGVESVCERIAQICRP